MVAAQCSPFAEGGFRYTEKFASKPFHRRRVLRQERLRSFPRIYAQGEKPFMYNDLFCPWSVVEMEKELTFCCFDFMVSSRLCRIVACRGIDPRAGGSPSW